MTVEEIAGAAPEADVVFASCDSSGTPGALNRMVLAHFRLSESFLPDADALTRGYAIRTLEDVRFCFVVTVGGGKTADLLRRNLSLALENPGLAGARSLWLPLMGTGAGGLSERDSRSITLDCLRGSVWARRQVRLTLAGPPAPTPSPRSRGASPNQWSGAREVEENVVASEDETPDWGPDAGRNLGPDERVDPYPWPRNEAAQALLEVTARLVRVGRSGERRLSTEMLLLALGQSGEEDLSDALKTDPAAAALRVALQRLAGASYPDVFNDYVDAVPLSASPSSDDLPPPTVNARNVLATASGAGGAKLQINVDGIVRALLSLPSGGVIILLGRLGLSSDDLLQAYFDERSQFIDLRLLNDLAGSVDRLGYDRYARAIADFLTHAQTPPPLSISIQAPWGAGKSSLMRQLRERLDPEEGRFPERSGQTTAPLTVAEVLALFNGSTRHPPVHTVGAKRRWTIWFNAWKYDTSEQVWAGLVDAIVAQISERLAPADREYFLLRLHLARIDDGLVRRKIYDRIAGLWWAEARRWCLLGVSAIAAAVGVGGAAQIAAAEEVKLTAALTGLAHAGYASALIAQVALAAYLVGSYFISRSKTKAEPAKFSLSDYVKVPDYSQAAGTVHMVHQDLVRVLELAPCRDDAAKAPRAAQDPIVVFIDDLDRCTPSKIAKVVEGVSMFLASDLYRCLFVIGMDPQLIAAALETEHAEVIARLPSYERAVPVGWRFMDKFVQLPFTIPPSSPKALRVFIDSLVPTASAPSRAPPPPPVDQAARTIATQSEPTLSPAQPNQLAMALKTAARLDVESREVGALVVELLTVAAGNPRELKRMANLARLYLGLRNARQAAEAGWRPPSLNAYARWIALTSRWPDALRWLLWGADEGTWSTAESDTPLVVRRLRFMEDAAAKANSALDWQAVLHAALRVPVADPGDWANDVKLYDQFKKEASLAALDRLSKAAETEFW